MNRYLITCKRTESNQTLQLERNACDKAASLDSLIRNYNVYLLDLPL